MEHFSSGDLIYLWFTIPGFTVVWTFRYFTKSKKNGDAEFLGLSFIWGLISLLLTEGYVHLLCWHPFKWVCQAGSYPDEIKVLLQNPFAAAMFLIMMGLTFGWIGSWFAGWAAFRRVLRFLTPERFKD